MSCGGTGVTWGPSPSAVSVTGLASVSAIKKFSFLFDFRLVRLDRLLSAAAATLQYPRFECHVAAGNAIPGAIMHASCGKNLAQKRHLSRYKSMTYRRFFVMHIMHFMHDGA